MNQAAIFYALLADHNPDIYVSVTPLSGDKFRIEAIISAEKAKAYEALCNHTGAKKALASFCAEKGLTKAQADQLDEMGFALFHTIGSALFDNEPAVFDATDDGLDEDEEEDETAED